MADIAVDSAFSVYHLVERVQSSSTLLNHRQTMSYISYEIENATLVDNVSNRIFSGFQYLSKFIPQIPRYRRIASTAESVYVFGVADVEPPAIDNITYVRLQPTDQLAKEWFLISYGREYYSALATEELTKFTDPDHERMFKGIWTFDLNLVGIIEEWLTSLVDAHPLTFTQEQINLTKQIQLMSNSLTRLSDRISKPMPDVRETQKVVISDELRAAFAQHDQT